MARVEGRYFSSAAYSLVVQVLIVPKLGQTRDWALIESSAKEVGKVLDVYEERLSKRKYLERNFYSLADLTHLPFIHYIVSATDKGYLITNRKHVNAWWEAIAAWKKVSAM